MKSYHLCCFTYDFCTFPPMSPHIQRSTFESILRRAACRTMRTRCKLSQFSHKAVSIFRPWHLLIQTKLSIAEVAGTGHQANWCLRKILSSTMLRSVHVAATVEVLFELDCCELCYLATGWTLVQGQAGDATAPNGGRSSWFGFPIFQVELNPAPPLHGGTRVSAQQVECVKVIWKVCVTAPRA